MPHVTFIHGIANKPPKDELLKQWKGALETGGLDLAAAGVSTTMVYWADVLYAEPEEDEEAHESVSAGLGTDDIDEDLAWTDDLPPEEAAVVATLRARLGFDEASPEDDQFSPPAPDEAEFEAAAIGFEAVPLPWFIKRRLMKALLRDTHHYLFRASHSPRPGETFDVQLELRNRFLDQLVTDSEAADGAHVVVSHSMGTVIAYDCLKNVDRSVAIDGFMTVGSPLGISEVHDNFDPRHIRSNAFPSEKVRGEWVNVYDRLDPVAFDARLANDYQRGGEKVITDQRVHNSGRWRHSAWKYFEQSTLVDHLRRLLAI